MSSNSIHIGNIIRYARLFNPQQAVMEDDAILERVAALFTMLQQRRIRYVLVGGIALLNYVQGRNTEDIDLIIALSVLKKLPEITITYKDLYFARGSYGALQIDFLLTRNPIFAYVQKYQVTQQTFVEQPISCATVEGLLLLKLYALPSLYRQGNFARVGIYENDIATLLYYYQPDIQPLLALLSKHVSSTDYEAVQATLADIQQRISRFQR